MLKLFVYRCLKCGHSQEAPPGPVNCYMCLNLYLKKEEEIKYVADDAQRA